MNNNEKNLELGSLVCRVIKISILGQDYKSLL